VLTYFSSIKGKKKLAASHTCISLTGEAGPRKTGKKQAQIVCPCDAGSYPKADSTKTHCKLIE
jgi:hypothetical protein